VPPAAERGLRFHGQRREFCGSAAQGGRLRQCGKRVSRLRNYRHAWRVPSHSRNSLGDQWGRRAPARALSACVRTGEGNPRRRARLHVVPRWPLEPDPLDEPVRAPPSRDQAPQCREHLPQRGRDHPPCWRNPARAEQRVGPLRSPETMVGLWNDPAVGPKAIPAAQQFAPPQASVMPLKFTLSSGALPISDAQWDGVARTPMATFRPVVSAKFGAALRSGRSMRDRRARARSEQAPA